MPLEPGPVVIVKHGTEKAHVYAEGGISFTRYVKGVGWIVNDRPSALIARYACAVRKLHAKV